MARGFVRKRERVWYAYWHEDGRQRSKAVSPRKKDAEDFLNRRVSELQSGDWLPLKSATFAEFAEKFEDAVAKVEYKPSTLKTFRYTMSSRLLPELGHLPLKEVSTERIQRLAAAWSEDGRSSDTVRKYVMTLRRVLGTAVEWGYLRSNPAVRVKLPRAQPRSVDYLRPAEVKQFLDAVPVEYKTLFMMLILTGARLGEALALRVDDIDWDSSTIHIERTLFQGKTHSPKTGNAVRIVAMSPSLHTALFEHCASVAPPGGSVYVFSTQSGSPIDAGNLRSRVFKPALKAAGIERSLRIHDLRHTFASLLINQGENLKVIQQQMGHGSIKVTVDIYGHLYPEAASAAVQRLDEVLFPSSSVGDSQD